MGKMLQFKPKKQDVRNSYVNHEQYGPCEVIEFKSVKDLADICVKYRGEMGLSQEELAFRAVGFKNDLNGLSRQTIAKLEGRNLKDMKVSTLLSLYNALGLRVVMLKNLDPNDAA